LFLHNEEHYNKEIKALTKAWQQKSLREKNKTVTKEQKLEAIAKFKKIAKSKVLNKLIDTEYQQVLLEIEKNHSSSVEDDSSPKNRTEENSQENTEPVAPTAKIKPTRNLKVTQKKPSILIRNANIKRYPR